MCYEEIQNTMRNDANELKCNVIGFNYRGVIKSKRSPRSKEDLITDGIAQVQRLLQEGVSPQNIILKGHSLGGAIATLVAHHFHQHGQPINIFNDRSFSSITNYIVGNIRATKHPEAWGHPRIGHKETWGGKLLGYLAKPFVKFGVSLVKWEFNSGKAFRAIPLAYKDYLVVRTKYQDRTDDHQDDGVVVHYASIHAALKDKRKKYKAVINHWITEINSKIAVSEEKIGKNTSQNLSKLEFAKNFLIEAKNHLKNRKMQAPKAERFQYINSDKQGITEEGVNLIDCHSPKEDYRLRNYFSVETNQENKLAQYDSHRAIASDILETKKSDFNLNQKNTDTPPTPVDTYFRNFVKRTWRTHGVHDSSQTKQEMTEQESKIIKFLGLEKIAMDFSAQKSYKVRSVFFGITTLTASGTLIIYSWNMGQDLSSSPPSFNINDPFAQFNISATILLGLSLLLFACAIHYRNRSTKIQKEILDDLIEHEGDALLIH